MIDYVHAIEGALAVLVLAGFIGGPLQWVSTDAARQRLFYLRDQLFDLARAGKLDFESANYRLLRVTFDRQIRFAHLLSFLKFLMLARAAQNVTRVARPIDGAIAEIEDKNTRAEVQKLVEEMNRTVVLMVFAKSPLLWVLVGLMAIYVLMVSLGRNLLKRTAEAPTNLIKDYTQKTIWRLAPLIHEEAAVLAA